MLVKLDEHLHVAKIMCCQIRQSAITTILIWNAYGSNSKATKAAYKWWKAATALVSELNEVSGEIGIYATQTVDLSGAKLIYLFVRCFA